MYNDWTAIGEIIQARSPSQLSYSNCNEVRSLPHGDSYYRCPVSSVQVIRRKRGQPVVALAMIWAAMFSGMGAEGQGGVRSLRQPHKATGDWHVGNPQARIWNRIHADAIMQQKRLRKMLVNRCG